mgnify:CR=1 FL=1
MRAGIPSARALPRARRSHAKNSPAVITNSPSEASASHDSSANGSTASQRHSPGSSPPRSTGRHSSSASPSSHAETSAPTVSSPTNN